MSVEEYRSEEPAWILGDKDFVGRQVELLNEVARGHVRWDRSVGVLRGWRRGDGLDRRLELGIDERVKLIEHCGGERVRYDERTR